MRANAGKHPNKNRYRTQISADIKVRAPGQESGTPCTGRALAELALFLTGWRLSLCKITSALVGDSNSAREDGIGDQRCPISISNASQAPLTDWECGLYIRMGRDVPIQEGTKAIKARLVTQKPPGRLI